VAFAPIWGTDWPNEIIGSCRNLLAGYVLNLGFVVYFFYIQDGVIVANLHLRGISSECLAVLFAGASDRCPPGRFVFIIVRECRLRQLIWIKTLALLNFYLLNAYEFDYFLNVRKIFYVVEYSDTGQVQ
jgi:hypothetical protein